jgi:hypothetical protein
MSRIKLILQVAGVALAGIGVCCLPLGFSLNPNNPKRDMSVFLHMADWGSSSRRPSPLSRWA